MLPPPIWTKFTIFHQPATPCKNGDSHKQTNLNLGVEIPQRHHHLLRFYSYLQAMDLATVG